MNTLMGKATDVIKVWLHSNPEITDMNVIFSVLRQTHLGTVSVLRFAAWLIFMQSNLTLRRVH